jgi:hypothetical protein
MFVSSTNKKEVAAQYTGAAKIVKVDGDYMVFETIDAYTTWKNQK